MVSHLRQSGHSVEIVSLPWRPYPLRLLDNGSESLKRRLAGSDYDVIVQDELCHPTLFLLNRRLRQLTRIPLIALVHQVLCDEPRQRLWNNGLAWIEKPYLASVDGFIFNSETTRRTVAGLIENNRPFVIATPGGDRFGGSITAEKIKARARQSGPLRLLFLGNVIARKGLLPLIESLRTVPHDRWELQVVGRLDMDPAYARHVRNRADALGLGSAIRFRGPLNGSPLVEVLENAHVLCMPFAYEGFGIVTLEAMSFGLPVIGSTAGATGEIVQTGVNGHLVNREDVRGAAAAIEQLAADRETLARMGVDATRRFNEFPGWRASMERIEVFLKHALHRQENRSG